VKTVLLREDELELSYGFGVVRAPPAQELPDRSFATLAAGSRPPFLDVASLARIVDALPPLAA
jgi:hypothetical protein